jgi:hypothetical protein
MNRDVSANRWLISSARVILALPLLALFTLMPRTGTVAQLSDGVTLQDAPLFACFIAAVLVLVVRRAKGIPIAIAFVFCSFSGQTLSAVFWNSERLEMTFYERGSVPGVSVFCNGVHLGESPLVVTDVDARVAEWDTPPDQPRVKPGVHSADLQSSERLNMADALWTWTPYDVSGRDGIDSPFQQFHSHSQLAVAKVFRNTKHWWRFEKDGCVGLCSAGNFTTRGSWNAGLRRFSANPPVEFPSVAPHLEALLDVVKDSGGEPDQQWLTHFLKYRDLLFTPLALRARAEPELLPIVEQLVDAQFGLPAEPTRDDCARVVSRVVQRIDELGSFTEPSLESVAILRVGSMHPEPIIELMNRRLSDVMVYGGDQRSEGEVTLERPRIRGRALLEFAMMHLQLEPPELFGRLVWFNRRDQFLVLIAQYETETAIDIVRSRMRSAVPPELNQIAARCRHFRNPALEASTRSMFERYDNNFRSDLQDYILARIQRGDVSDDFAAWVAEQPGTQGSTLGILLAQIRSPSTAAVLQILGKANRQVRISAMQQLSVTPNPFLEEYVVSECRSDIARAAREQYYAGRSLVALGSYDSPQVRAIVEELLVKGGPLWRTLVYETQSADWPWLVPQLAVMAAEDEESARLKVMMLSHIGTDEAWQMIAGLADDQRVDPLARNLLDRHTNEERARTLRLQQGRDLIAGRKHPDDLLPPAQKYVWTASGYVLSKLDAGDVSGDQ